MFALFLIGTNSWPFSEVAADLIRRDAHVTPLYCVHKRFNMMMSSDKNNFRVAGPLLGESIGYRCIPLTKASDAEL